MSAQQQLSLEISISQRNQRAFLKEIAFDKKIQQDRKDWNSLCLEGTQWVYRKVQVPLSVIALKKTLSNAQLISINFYCAQLLLSFQILVKLFASKTLIFVHTSFFSLKFVVYIPGSSNLKGFHMMDFEGCLISPPSQQIKKLVVAVSCRKTTHHKWLLYSHWPMCFPNSI